MHQWPFQTPRETPPTMNTGAKNWASPLPAPHLVSRKPLPTAFTCPEPGGAEVVCAGGRQGVGAAGWEWLR